MIRIGGFLIITELIHRRVKATFDDIQTIGCLRYYRCRGGGVLAFGKIEQADPNRWEERDNQGWGAGQKIDLAM